VEKNERKIKNGNKQKKINDFALKKKRSFLKSLKTIYLCHVIIETT